MIRRGSLMSDNIDEHSERSWEFGYADFSDRCEDDGDLGLDTQSEHCPRRPNAMSSLLASSSSSPQKPRSLPKLRKSVSFSNCENKVHEIIGKNDYSTEERKACWFSGPELQKTMMRCQQILLNHSTTNNNSNNDDNDGGNQNAIFGKKAKNSANGGGKGRHSTRGLERYSPMGLEITKMIHRASSDAVLKEQEKLKKSNSFETMFLDQGDSLFQQYRIFSQRSQSKAIELARQDSRDARKIFLSSASSCSALTSPKRQSRRRSSRSKIMSPSFNKLSKVSSCSAVDSTRGKTGSSRNPVPEACFCIDG